MKLSNHAISRSQQRGITFKTIETIMKYGNPQSKPGSVTELFLSNKEIEQLINDAKILIKNLENAKGKAIRISNETSSTIITVFHKNRKII